MSPSISTINDIQEIESTGPWHTKSGGELSVLFNIPHDILQTVFFSYDTHELAAVPQDIRGMRSYRVTDIPKGAIGAHEWHKMRHELVFVTSGSVRWTCEDVNGNQKVSVLDNKRGIWVRPFVLHTYESLVENTSLLVITNTLYIPEDPATHDSYSAEVFKELQSSSPTSAK